MAHATERCPGEGGAQDDARGDGIRGSLATPLRRRRVAAWRLPPLGDGRRDPFDALAGLAIAEPEPCHRGMFGADGTWRACCRGVG
jgi:hypothetical protein